MDYINNISFLSATKNNNSDINKPIGLLRKDYQYMVNSLSLNEGNGSYSEDGFGTRIGYPSDPYFNSTKSPYFITDSDKRKYSNYMEYIKGVYDPYISTSYIGFGFGPDGLSFYATEVNSDEKNDNVGVVRNFDPEAALDGVLESNPNVIGSDTLLGQVSSHYAGVNLHRKAYRTIDAFGGISRSEFLSQNNITASVAKTLGMNEETEELIPQGLFNVSDSNGRYNKSFSDEIVSPVYNKVGFGTYNSLPAEFRSLYDMSSNATKSFILKSIKGIDLLYGDTTDEAVKKYYAGTDGTAGNNFIDRYVDSVIYDTGVDSDAKIRYNLMNAGNMNLSEGVEIEYAEKEGAQFGEIVRDETSDVESGDYFNRGSNYGRYNVYDGNETKDDLVSKTNKMFINGKSRTLISRFHTSELDSTSESNIQTSISKQFGLSHGRNLLKKNALIDRNGNNGMIDKTNGYENPYCRVWTFHHQYHRLIDAIRPVKKDENGNGYSVVLANDFDKYSSVNRIQNSGGTFADIFPYGRERLDDLGVKNKFNGLVNMTPIKGDGDGDFKVPTKQCMFSIENLAWRGFFKSDKNFEEFGLSPEQKGPFGGRIMYFPPYGLTFSENNSVNWNETDFIGRGEKIYTYTNTERSGTLSFVVLIDHPSVANCWRNAKNNSDGKPWSENKGVDYDNKENSMLRFFAGCDYVIPNCGKEKITKVSPPPEVIPKKVVDTLKVCFYVYFPNNYSGIDNSWTPSKSNVDAISYLLNGIGASYASENGLISNAAEIYPDMNNSVTIDTDTKIGGYEVRDSNGEASNYIYSTSTSGTVLGNIGLSVAKDDSFFYEEEHANGVKNSNKQRWIKHFTNFSEKNGMGVVSIGGKSVSLYKRPSKERAKGKDEKKPIKYTDNFWGYLVDKSYSGQILADKYEEMKDTDIVYIKKNSGDTSSISSESSKIMVRRWKNTKDDFLDTCSFGLNSEIGYENGLKYHKKTGDEAKNYYSFTTIVKSLENKCDCLINDNSDDSISANIIVTDAIESYFFKQYSAYTTGDNAIYEKSTSGYKLTEIGKKLLNSQTEDLCKEFIYNMDENKTIYYTDTYDNKYDYAETYHTSSGYDFSCFQNALTNKGKLAISQLISTYYEEYVSKGVTTVDTNLFSKVNDSIDSFYRKGKLYDEDKIKILKEIYKNYKLKEIDSTGYASMHGYTKLNEKLSNHRGYTIGNWVRGKLNQKEASINFLPKGKGEEGDVTDYNSVSSFDAKVNRCAEVVLVFERERNENATDLAKEKSTGISQKVIKDENDYKYDTYSGFVESFYSSNSGNTDYFNTSLIETNGLSYSPFEYDSGITVNGCKKMYSEMESTTIKEFSTNPFLGFVLESNNGFNALSAVTDGSTSSESTYSDDYEFIANEISEIGYDKEKSGNILPMRNGYTSDVISADGYEAFGNYLLMSVSGSSKTYYVCTSQNDEDFEKVIFVYYSLWFLEKSNSGNISYFKDAKTFENIYMNDGYRLIEYYAGENGSYVPDLIIDSLSKDGKKEFFKKDNIEECFGISLGTYSSDYIFGDKGYAKQIKNIVSEESYKGGNLLTLDEDPKSTFDPILYMFSNFLKEGKEAVKYNINKSVNVSYIFDYDGKTVFYKDYYSNSSNKRSSIYNFINSNLKSTSYFQNGLLKEDIEYMVFTRGNETTDDAFIKKYFTELGKKKYEESLSATNNNKSSNMLNSDIFTEKAISYSNEGKNVDGLLKGNIYSIAHQISNGDEKIKINENEVDVKDFYNLFFTQKGVNELGTYKYKNVVSSVSYPTIKDMMKDFVSSNISNSSYFYASVYDDFKIKWSSLVEKDPKGVWNDDFNYSGRTEMLIYFFENKVSSVNGEFYLFYNFVTSSENKSLVTKTDKGKELLENNKLETLMFESVLDGKDGTIVDTILNTYFSDNEDFKKAYSEYKDKNTTSSKDGENYISEQAKTSTSSSVKSTENKFKVTEELDPKSTRYDNEYEFFRLLKINEPIVYNEISKKIDFFDPAFHSISPEGFNSRLTFLNQCLRAGNTNNNDYNTANNLAFGRSPYCILRIGDFYYTKIVINSLNIEYDNQGIKWDLNPEGIGVMPMYAKITMQFKFIGGSDLGGPINRLQNALSFNYYANTGVYDNRSEMVEYNYNEKTRKPEIVKFKGYNPYPIESEVSASSAKSEKTTEDSKKAATDTNANEEH